MEKARRSVAQCAGECDRYFGLGGEEISCKMGDRAWLGASRAPRLARAGRFRLKEFHRPDLALGFVGLEQLRQDPAPPLFAEPT